MGHVIPYPHRLDCIIGVCIAFRMVLYLSSGRVFTGEIHGLSDTESDLYSDIGEKWTLPSDDQ